ncbi:hypothetical protein LZ496_03940 [Sphingomonas sp. NSE70-1]|uniref:Uncharacterized protein n=1 Tax=Sphingomonas caseinilyticus TaxID=2908205 RepID=A0ABT0RTA6_9SPHN|nr:hypothetical protein [Sphingomonas caseinilyticus]MCL6697935.1 hypothetical protein [Sphingomonas caseinilyticus]
MMWALLVMLAGQQATATYVSPPVVSIEPSIRREPIYADPADDVAVHFVATPFGTVAFTSHLPVGWTFRVNIDGNQDGAWGSGHGMPDNSVQTSPDRTFAQDARNGVFCSQYVFTTFEKDPTSIQVSSECGDLKSNGRVSMSGVDGKGRATITLELPSEEVFGTAQTVRIQTCVWNTERWSCQHRLPELLELKRTAIPR